LSRVCAIAVIAFFFAPRVLVAAEPADQVLSGGTGLEPAADLDRGPGGLDQHRLE